MVKLKTEVELRTMKEGGARLKKVVTDLMSFIVPGVTTESIDKKAEELILKYGGEPSFKRVKNYFWSTCLPVNEQIVHTPPSSRKVEDGDVLTLDIGFYFEGFHTDFAKTFSVGKNKSNGTERFLKTGEQALQKAIKKVKSGHHLGEVSKTIEEEVGRSGYHVSHELTGHGIGENLHEDPLVPGFLDRPIKETYLMRPGLAIAVEVIYAMKTGRIRFEKGSDWSIRTADKSLSACFEHTVAVFHNENTSILT